jgi:small subunit ribosomal protein S16
MKGVAKGAFTKEVAEVRFNEWKAAKVNKVESAEKAIELAAKTEMKKRLEAEAKVNEARAAEIAKKRLQEAQAAAGVTEEAPAEEAAEETAAENTEENAAE